MSQDQEKYLHPVKNFFITRFLSKILGEIRLLQAKKILDVGCGEGFADRFFLDRDNSLRIFGIDIEENFIKAAKERNPEAVYKRGDINSLGISGKNYDLVLMIEVLEHLKEPEKAISEIKKLAPMAIFSVPNEPWFSLLSLFSGSYIRTKGKHPDHINFWNNKSFKRLLLKYYHKVRIVISFPWLIAVCER